MYQPQDTAGVILYSNFYAIILIYSHGVSKNQTNPDNMMNWSAFHASYGGRVRTKGGEGRSTYAEARGDCHSLKLEWVPATRVFVTDGEHKNQC